MPGNHWNRRVWQLAWPAILSSLSVPLAGVVDTAVVGHLDDPRYLSAVAVGAIIFSSVFWVFGFLRMGTTGFVSQAHGRGDAQAVSMALLRALLLAGVLGLVIISLQGPLGSVAFALMNTGQEVTATAWDYFSIRIWSAPATFSNYVVLGCLIGLQRMYAALLTQLILNVTNICLDAVFVIGLGWDADGVALATVISEYLAAAVGLWLLRDKLLLLRAQPRHALRAELHWEKWRALLSVNADLFVRTLFLTSAFFFFTAQSAQFGVVVLAANAILINMLQMIAYGLDGFAHAAEALAGSAFGAGKRTDFAQIVRSSTLMAGVVALLICLLYAAGGDLIISLMTSIPSVQAASSQYLFWVTIAPLVAIWSYLLDGVFIGATATRAMRNTVGMALLIYVLLVYWLVPIWGNHALWLSLLAFLLLRGILLGISYPKLVRQMNND